MLAAARRRAAILGWLAAGTAWGQTPEFDAVSVKVVRLASHPAFGNSGGPGTSDPGRVHLCCVGMFSLVMRAYDVELDQISGPAWIMDNVGSNLYQIDAAMPAGTTRAELQLMMRNLLAERFHLAAHRERRNFPGYELVVADRGAKLKESRPDANFVETNSPQMPKRNADGALVLPPGPQMFTSLGRGMVIVQGQEKPVGDLVKVLGRLIAQSLGEDPNDFASPKPRVIDKTGLSGKYDFTLRLSCDGCQFSAANGMLSGPLSETDASGSAPDIFVGIEKQLGLKLVKTKDIPLDVIVIDHVDKMPVAN